MINVSINIDLSQLNLESQTNNCTGKGGAFDTALKAGAEFILPVIKTRIHEEGKASDGSEIGHYSRKPMYVNPALMHFTFPVTGKTGKTIFAGGKKKGQAHSTGYFSGGYNEFKTAIAQNNPGKVNLFLTGELKENLTPIETTNGWALGWLNDELSTRAASLEQKYGKEIWSLSDSELGHLTETIQQAIKL